MKKRIRERVYAGFREDGGALLDELSAEERRRIFRHWESGEDDRHPENINTQEDSQFLATLEKSAIQTNIGNLLAFIYLGIEETNFEDFEDILESAMDTVAQERDQHVSEFNFHIEFEDKPDEPTGEQIFNALKDGKIGVGKLTLSQISKVVGSDAVDWRELSDEQQERIIEGFQTMDSIGDSLETAREELESEMSNRYSKY